MKRTMQQGFTLIELMIVVAIIGILAAVAIPAYQDYTARAQVSEMLTLTAGQKTALAEYHTSNGTFPATASASDVGINNISGKYVSSVSLQSSSQNGVTLRATMKSTGVANAIQGASFDLVGTATSGAYTWKCSAVTDTHAKYIPSSCK